MNDVAIASVLNLWRAMSDEDRVAALDAIGREFCLECGREDPHCQCDNDE